MREEPINNTTESAQDILNDVEKRIEATENRIEALSIYINYMYTHPKLRLQGIKRRVKDVKENTCKTKSNKSEVGLEAALKLLQSIQDEERRIGCLEEYVEKTKEENREMINRAEERLKLMYEQIELLPSGQIGGVKVGRWIKDIRREVDETKEAIDDILLDPYELKLIGSQVYDLHIQVCSIETSIIHQMISDVEKRLSKMELRRNILSCNPFINVEEVSRRIEYVKELTTSMAGQDWEQLIGLKVLNTLNNYVEDGIGRNIRDIEAKAGKQLILFILFYALIQPVLSAIMAALPSITMEIQI